MDYKTHYSNLKDDELLRVWSDTSELEEDALDALSLEVKKRRLLDERSAESRIAEIRADTRNVREIEKILQIGIAIGAIFAGIALLFLIVWWIATKW